MAKVSVRSLCAGDQHWLYQAAQDTGLNYWFIGKPEPYLPEHAHRFVSEKITDRPYPDYRMGIFVDGEGSGGINLRQSDHDKSKHLLSYWIVPKHQRKGVAFAAVSEFLRIMDMLHPWLRICATVETTNQPSIKLLSKLGFDEVGTCLIQAKNRRAGELIEAFKFVRKQKNCFTNVKGFV